MNAIKCGDEYQKVSWSLRKGKTEKNRDDDGEREEGREQREGAKEMEKMDE